MRKKFKLSREAINLVRVSVLSRFQCQLKHFEFQLNTKRSNNDLFRESPCPPPPLLPSSLLFLAFFVFSPPSYFSFLFLFSFRSLLLLKKNLTVVYKNLSINYLDNSLTDLKFLNICFMSVTASMFSFIFVCFCSFHLLCLP